MNEKRVQWLIVDVYKILSDILAKFSSWLLERHNRIYSIPTLCSYVCIIFMINVKVCLVWGENNTRF